MFEKYFLDQGFNDNRTIDETIDLGWDLLCLLKKEELDRMDSKLIEAHYDPRRAERFRQK